MKPSLTILMPAYNEADTLEAAYKNTTSALLRANITDYEIIILTLVAPDCTNDGTPRIARNIAESDPRVKNLHSSFYTSLGFKYREGVRAATKEYVAMVPAHNLTDENSLADIFSRVGTADSILTYTSNPETRPLRAMIVSRCFVVLCNLLFGLHINYFNGITVHRRSLLQLVPMSANNHAYMAEIIIYLVKSGVQYRELPQVLKPTTRAGKAFNLQSAFSSFLTLVALFWNVQIKDVRIKK